MTVATATTNRSTARTMESAPPSEFQQFMARSVTYTPLAEEDPIELSIGMARNYLAVRSKTGKLPGDGDLMKFLMLCKSRRLNPFVGDAYLIGYDTRDGTKWNLITAVQALLKRAEANQHYDGMECGVVIRTEGGGREEREGSLFDDGEKLLGGWARVYRKDRSKPSYASLKFTVYDTGLSRWAKDPGGMIVKCAVAAALRPAFPSDLSALYLREEFDTEATASRDEQRQAFGVAALKEQLMGDPASAGDGIDPPHSDADDAQGEASSDSSEAPADNPAGPTPEELREQHDERGFDDRPPF